MTTKRISVLFVILALASGALCGCGGNGDGNGGQTTFKAKLQHFGGEDLVPGIELIVLNNGTGDETDLKATTDSSGWVSFKEEILDEAVEDEDGDLVVGFRAKGAKVGGAMYKDTYQFNIDAAVLDERLWVVDESTYLGAPLMAGVTLEPGKAVLAGGIYWVDSEEIECHVGCATAKIYPESGDVRYFGDNGMPTTIESRPTTNPLVAYYLVANIEPGPTVARAYMCDNPPCGDEDEIGHTSLHVYADAISISNIYADTAEDPTPANCE